MEKLFNFIRSLKPSFYEVCGYPTIKVYSDFSEVYFYVTGTINDLEVFDVACDEFRMFPGDGCITFVFTFYNLPFED